MAESDVNAYLNPITLASQVFLQSLELYGPKNQVVDIELLNTMDKLIDAINKFYDECKTQIEENEKLKLVKAKEFDYILPAYTCKRCEKYLGPSAEKAVNHVTSVHGFKPEEETRSKHRLDAMKVTKQKQKNLHHAAVKKPKPLIQPEVKLPKKARTLLTEKISKFFCEPLQIAKGLKELPIYDEIEKDLLNVVKPLYPEKSIKIYKFGSRMCGIGSENSDLDIFIDIDESFYNFENRASERTLSVVTKVCGALEKNKKWSKVLSIENARVPIIRTLHSSQISCDLGFSNSLGPCNTLLMEYYFELQPIASRMCIYLKKWVHRTKLNDVFSTYSLTLMIIFFLQQNAFLPSVQDLQNDMKDDEKIMVGPWISNFQKRTLKECSLKPILQPTKANFRDIMVDFFKFIGHFEFQNFIMCPYFGHVISIKDGVAQLPKRYSEFVVSNGALSELHCQGKACIVQDPIQLNHNITKNVSPTMLKLFVNFAEESGRILSENMENDDHDILA